MSVDSVLAAMADPTRRSILEKLHRKGEMSVGDIAKGMKVSRPAVSQHLSVLRGAGLVREQKEATRRLYSVEFRGVLELRRYLDDMWSRAMQEMARVARD